MAGKQPGEVPTRVASETIAVELSSHEATHMKSLNIGTVGVGRIDVPADLEMASRINSKNPDVDMEVRH